ncbi:hypothetical protein [Actinacidiphila sp. bgisy167]|uniref:carboxypeptidase-like regulatory domain-containing protein n=1 Tax=Actinacidiphila sp. bgisy167 TaxID=3413797 RepID=UPI003D754663
MPVDSRRALALIVSVAALSSGFAVTPALADDAGPLGIGVARTADAERGSFTVPVWTDEAGSAITSVTATVRDGDSVVVDALALSGVGERWSVPSGAPLRLTEDGGAMPHLGRYAIDVTATDDQGRTVTRTDAGILDFTLRPVLAGTGLTRTELDKDHRTTAVTGTLLGVQPGSGDQVPIEGATVDVTCVYDSSAGRPDGIGQAVTGADGSFTSPQFPIGSWAELKAAFSANDERVHGAATEGAGSPRLRQTSVVVTAKADRTRAVPGQAVTISGSVKDSAGAPVAGVPVRLWLTAGTAVTVTSNASGAFSGKVIAAPYAYGAWSAAEADPYLTASGAASGSIVLPADSLFTEVSAKIGADAKVTMSARLYSAYDRVTSIYRPQVVHLEYSKDGRTGWQDLGKANAADNGSVVTIAKWGNLDGYYRLHHYVSDQFAESATKPVRLTRTNTRMYSIKASATKKVKKGATVTFTGTLKEYVSKSWRPYKGRHVELFFQKKGSTKWTYVSSGTTSSTGKATLKGKPSSDGTWLIQYFGDSKHFNSDGTPVYVDVR